MNDDDPGPSSAAWQPPPRSDAEYDARELDQQHHVRPEESSRSHESPLQRRQRQHERRRQGIAKKLEFITHLQKSLDMIVFVFICTLYSMECSFFRFLLRLFPHYSFLTPKDGLFLPAEQPHIYTIFVPGMLCILAHLFFALPQAGEATRGYLHGGVIIDFIGQRPPTTRLAFLYFDLVILAAQCLMLAVHQEREKLKKAVSPGLRTISPTAVEMGQAAPATETAQDHDAEERGVRRDEPYAGEGSGVEMEPLSRGEGSREAGNPAEDDRTGNTYASAAASADMLDIIRSGNAVLGNFHVIHAVRSVADGAHSAAAYSLRTFSYSATLAAMAAERRSRPVRRQ
ncbi:hypothetical protein VTI74DRAFT_10901 [Chaetomium olivicolor]